MNMLKTASVSAHCSWCRSVWYSKLPSRLMILLMNKGEFFKSFDCILCSIIRRFSCVVQIIATNWLWGIHASYETVVKRWPVILAGIVDQIHRENHDNTLHLQAQKNSAQKQALEIKIAEGKAIIENISKLKYEMARDHVMEWVLTPSQLSGTDLSI